MRRSNYFTTINQKPQPLTIGGLPIGYNGQSGIYSGYSLAGGDEFNGAPSTVNIFNPTGRYFTTHAYGAGGRSVNGPLQYSYDMDRFHTGSQDSNRGLSVGTTTLNQVAGTLTLQARQANAGELPYINGRQLVAAMIHTGAYFTVTPPCIIEAQIYFTSPSTNPQGWHPTFWTLSADPLANPQSGTPGWLEFDSPECSSQGGYMNYNTHGSPAGWPVNSSSQGSLLNSPNIMGTGRHLVSQVITASSVAIYMDGTLIRTIAFDGTATGLPYYILFTSHTFNASYGSDANVNLSAWNSSGTMGATLGVDFYRAWLSNSSPINIVTPLQSLPTLQVNYNSSMTYTFPSLATLYGAGFSGTDYCASCKVEDFEPGASAEANSIYTNSFPAGLSFNTGTRVLTGITTDKKPGRLWVSSTPTLTGGCVGYVAKGYIDVGPNITATDFVLVKNVAASVDLYNVCDCGTLVPKVITCTGLPAGLSFNATTGLITGTPTVSATTSITIGVTNAVGQTASKSVNLIVQNAADAIALDGTVASTSGTATITTTLPRDIIVAVLTNTAVSAPCTYITDTAGLTWVKRNAVLCPSSGFSVETWFARANSTVTSNVITPSSNSFIGRIEVFAINGIDMINPFDTNTSLPALVPGTTATTASATISTTNANTFVYAVVKSLASLGTITQPAGFTTLVAGGTTEDLSYQINSSALSSVTETYSWTGATTQSAMLIDALQGQA